MERPSASLAGTVAALGRATAAAEAAAGGCGLARSRRRCLPRAPVRSPAGCPAGASPALQVGAGCRAETTRPTAALSGEWPAASQSPCPLRSLWRRVRWVRSMRRQLHALTRSEPLFCAPVPPVGWHGCRRLTRTEVCAPVGGSSFIRPDHGGRRAARDSRLRSATIEPGHAGALRRMRTIARVRRANMRGRP